MAPKVKPAGEPAPLPEKTHFDKCEREEAKAFLADAKLLYEMNPDPDSPKDMIGQWEKPDGSLWIERNRYEDSRYDHEYSLSLRVPVGTDDAATLTSYRGDVELLEPAVKVESRGYIDLHFLANGDLRVQANRFFYENFDEVLRSVNGQGTDGALWDLFEGFRSNGWSVVDDSTMGGGAFAITNSGGGRMSDGEIGYYDEYWDHRDYVTENPVEALFERGHILFEHHKTSEWLDADQIRDWKIRTNKDYRESEQQDFDLWPLDEAGTPAPPVSCTVTAQRDNIRVELDWIGEGESGDFDPEDPDDTKLMRFTVLKCEQEDPAASLSGGSWEAVSCASYCTNISADLPRETLQGLAEKILEQVYQPLSEGKNIKGLCERLSHMDNDGHYMEG